MNKAVTISVIVGTIVLIVGIALGWYGFPAIVAGQITENVVLKNNTAQFERFEELPLPLDFKVYIFTIKNKDEINNGGKPIVEEKGPYIYQQTRRKTNLTWINNKINYYEYQNYEFNEIASGNLKETDEITVLNPALISVFQILELLKMDSILKLFTPEVVKLVFGDISDVFITTTVKKFLFDGFTICDLDEINKETDKNKRLYAITICLGVFLVPARNLKVVEGEKKILFTFLNHKNTTHDGHFTINSGINNIHQVGLIEKWENSKYLSKWVGDTSSCNKIAGRDAVIFEPLLKGHAPITVFNTDICRKVDLQFVKEVEYRDALVNEYQLTEETLKAPSDEDLNSKCYCLNVTKGIHQENGCMEKGLLELFTCYNAPILLSFPHFLFADEKYKSAVEGLKDNVEKHRTFVHLEPNTGTPLAGSKRVQFNMFVRKIRSLDNLNILDNYEDPKLVPILWLDERFDITDDLYQMLYDQYLSKIVIIDGVTWGIISLGIVVIIVSLAIFWWKKRKSVETV